MIILDTQPVSQLQRAGSSDAARIEQRINSYSAQKHRAQKACRYDPGRSRSAHLPWRPARRHACTLDDGGRPARLPYPLSNRRDVVVPPTEAN
jgi:hypothetical protein